MADEFSFDIVSKTDIQAVDDAVNAANREVAVRFDFRGSPAKIELDKVKSETRLSAEDENRMKSLVEILKSRLAKRGVDLKGLEFQKMESALGGAVKQVAKISQGISSEKAKEIVADIKASKIKVTPSIQSEQVRVTSKSKDSLQQAMALLKPKDYGIPLQFTNFR